MNMAAMNPAVGGGPVGGGMMMGNNTGSPALQPGGMSSEPIKLLLNTYIYEYFLKVGLYDIARTLVKEDKFEMRTSAKQSPGRRKDGEVNGTDGDGMDMDGKDNIPDDLPRPANIADSGQQGSGFLFEWFAVFSDIFTAHRSQNKMAGVMTPAQQYLFQHQNYQRMRESQQNQTLRPGMPPNSLTRINANQMRQHGVINGDMARKLTPQQIQMVQQNQKAQMQQQMQREAQGDGDPNARPGTPADGENGGSPSKRPRLDSQPFNNGMMPNGGRPVPGGQNMMIQAGFNPNMGGQFRQGGGMPPKGMATGVANGMVNMANTGSPMMQAINQFPDGIPGDVYNGRPPMAPVMPGAQNGQSGNHALQDYQMQLMLLEQQNKKRLMMARQEQHESANPHAGQAMPGGVNMQQGMSPSGSRTSPNPSEQMKRTPQIGGMPGSPSAGDMQGRSPANLSFMNGMPQDFNNPAMFMSDNKQMMGGPGAPNMRPPTSVDMVAMNRAQQQGRMGNQFQQGGQPMTQQPSQGQPQPGGTPGPRSEMPPPSNPPVGPGAQRNNQPASPANSNAPPTPSTANKPNPKTKKGKEDTKQKRPAKKTSLANAPNADDPPVTPTSSTAMTPVHNNSFNGANAKGGPNAQQNPAMQGNQPQMQQPELVPTNAYPDFNTSDPNYNIPIDFGALENVDVLENFDFDTFLNTSTDDTFPFEDSLRVEGFGMDATGE